MRIQRVLARAIKQARPAMSDKPFLESQGLCAKLDFMLRADVRKGSRAVSDLDAREWPHGWKAVIRTAPVTRTVLEAASVGAENRLGPIRCGVPTDGVSNGRDALAEKLEPVALAALQQLRAKQQAVAHDW